ncbi:MAG TPA: tetratricopeptide repeat protein, partial [Terriglobales bacterium]|nr:tetratricopeptide repeat protein [Terriglobales bacterium]
PKHKTAFNDLGLAYLALGKYDEAEQAFKKAIEIDPYSAFAYTNLGRTYYAQRRYADAEPQFRKQIDVDPLDKAAHYYLGEMLNREKRFADAEPELEKANSITPDNPGVLMALGTAQLALGKNDKAQASFSKAVSVSPSPGTWNNVAYALAEHKVNLDLAQQYAESAVTTIAAQLRNVELSNLTMGPLFGVNFLGMSWDTLGWVHFQKGNLPQAEKYLLAAWNLGQSATAADHLGQLYESKGERDKAIDFYSKSLAASQPDPETRTRLAKLIGDKKVDKLVAQQREKLDNERTFAIPGATGEGTADFYVKLSPASKVEDVRYIAGNDKLKDLSDSLKGVDFKPDFPDNTDTRLVRRGVLSCASNALASNVVKHASSKEKDQTEEEKGESGPCTFELIAPENVRTVN